MPDRTPCLFLFVFLVIVGSLAQTDVTSQSNGNSARNTVQDLTPEQKAKMERLGKLQRDFGRKMNSPGVELSLKETKRSRAGDRTLVTYDLYETGLPAGTTFTLVQVQIDGTIIKVMQGVTFNAAGEAICAGREGTCQGNVPNDPVDLVVYAGKGEPKRFGLVSDDEAHVRGFIGVVPFPNAASDKSCRLESIIGTPNGETTYIQGTGFEPNAELVVDSESYGEKHHDIDKAQTDGSFFMALLPYVAGKKSGKTTIEVKSKSCDPKLTLEWGQYHLE